MIKDLLNIEGSVDDNFMVKSVEKGVSTSSNKEYFNIVLQDVTGTIDARKWDVLPGDEEIIVPGAIIGVHGAVLKYRNKPQVKINTVERVNPDLVDRSLFVETAPLPLKDIIAQVKTLVDSIKDPDIKAVCEGVMKDNWAAYTHYPAAVTVHEAYETGLIFHCLYTCKVALAVADLYPELFHRDYIICGTLLHDIGKVQELSGPVQTKYTRIGKLESHIQIGAMIINAKCHELGIPQEKTDLLTHIILSHHGQPEYGSPVVPKTADAVLVHFADDMDAKANILQNALKGVAPGEFTTRIQWLDGIEIYKPTFDK